MTTPTFADRVQEVFTTTGTGTYSLGGAVTGYRAFSTVMSNSGTCYYCATDGTNWEVGLGTYTTSGNTLARTTIEASSNANAAVNWSAGTKNIWLDFPAVAVPGPAAVATTSVAGTVIPDGTIITVDGSGHITVPTATPTVFGVVKVDNTTITEAAGVISASFAGTPNKSQSLPSNKSNVSNTAMCGLAGAITPSGSGAVLVIISGEIKQAAGSFSGTVQLSYGTGSAPATNAAVAGTQVGQALEVDPTNSAWSPFSLNYIISGLTSGTAYWLDLYQVELSPGNTNYQGLSISAYELK